MWKACLCVTPVRVSGLLLYRIAILLLQVTHAHCANVYYKYYWQILN